MARSTMSLLIQDLRGMTDTTYDDYTVGQLRYWTDDQLNNVLDRRRREVFRHPLSPIETYSAGTVQYLDYPLPFSHLERTSGGTAIFYIQDGTNTTIGTANYTIDYNRGYITFNSNTSGSVYYLYARHYDMDAAAADVWRQKASHYTTAFDFSTDNHSVKRGDLMKHCLDMADYYEKRSSGGTNVVTMIRSDYAINS